LQPLKIIQLVVQFHVKVLTLSQKTHTIMIALDGGRHSTYTMIGWFG